MSSPTKFLGIERYKVLSAMLTLPEFTSAQLSSFTGVKIDTVRTAVKREEYRYLERVARQADSRQPGGQFIIYRVRPDKLKELRAEVRGLFEQVKVYGDAFTKDTPINVHPSLSGFVVQPGDSTSATTDPDSDRAEESEVPLKVSVAEPERTPLSLEVSENVLLKLLPRAETPEERRHLLKVAELNIDSALSNIEAMPLNDATWTDALTARVRAAEFLHELSLAELSDRSPHLFGQLARRFEETKEELSRCGESERASAIKDRVLASTLRDVVAPLPGAVAPVLPVAPWLPGITSMPAVHAPALMAAAANPYSPGVSTYAKAAAAAAFNSLGSPGVAAAPAEDPTAMVLQNTLMEVERVRGITDQGERLDECYRLAGEARKLYQVDETTIFKVADELTVSNATRLNGEVLCVLVGEPAFYVQPVFKVSDQGGILQLMPYMGAAHVLRDAGRNPGLVAERMFARLRF